MKIGMSRLAVIALSILGVNAAAQAQETAMSFFVTSAGPGKGGDLGGLAGADNHCQTLAVAAGAGSKTWHAYLSTQGSDAINARDRIGTGPWSNAKGAVIAKSVDDLHSAANTLSKQTVLTEKAAVVNGRGDTPNTHDILTGSSAEGRSISGDADMTCKNWTSNAAGAAMVGHSDRIGRNDTEESRSWNSAHASHGPGGGCAQADLQGTGGAGLLYCFAVK